MTKKKKCVHRETVRRNDITETNYKVNILPVEVQIRVSRRVVLIVPFTVSSILTGAVYRIRQWTVFREPSVTGSTEGCVLRETSRDTRGVDFVLKTEVSRDPETREQVGHEDQ